MRKPLNERERGIFEDAVSGLQEYYACLNDGTLVGELESFIVVPDTGNDQLDYENVRDQVEKFARQNEEKYVE